jgi:rubrerythrin
MKEKKPSAGSLLKMQASVKEKLAESLRQQLVAENELAQLQQQRKDIAKEEEGHWDKFAIIQQSKKEREMDNWRERLWTANFVQP